MKIAFNAWFLESTLSQNSGTGQYARHLLDALREITPETKIELVEPHGRGDLAKVRFEQFEFPHAARRMGADIAFVPHWGPPLRSAVPVVTTIHDVIQLALPAYRGGAKQRAYFSLARASALEAAAILTDSNFSARDIATHIGADPARISAVPLGVESRFSPALGWEELDRVRAQYSLPEQYVLYLGGFDARKNIETLFQVYGWCGESIGDDFPLVISGSADDVAIAADGARHTLGEMASALGVLGDVRFIGRPPDADKPALYAMARAFLYPTLYEGFGLPALEAMASGVPVVGSNASSVPEVVGESGMLVDPLDARVMAGALIAVCIQDDLHARLRSQAIMRASRFTWQRTAYETLAVFKRVARAGDI